MIKFTAVLMVLYALNCFFLKLYFSGRSVSDKVRLSFMMQPMKHIFLKRMYHILFMSVKVQGPVLSSFAAFPRMQVLQVCGLALP